MGRKRAKREPSPEEEPVYDVEKILDRRMTEGIIEYYIKWVGYTEDHNSWEPKDHLDSVKGWLVDYDRVEDAKKKLEEEGKKIISLEEKLEKESNKILSLEEKLGEETSKILSLEEKLGEETNKIVSLEEKLKEVQKELDKERELHEENKELQLKQDKFNDKEFSVHPIVSKKSGEHGKKRQDFKGLCRKFSRMKLVVSSMGKLRKDKDQLKDMFTDIGDVIEKHQLFPPVKVDSTADEQSEDYSSHPIIPPLMSLDIPFPPTLKEEEDLQMTEHDISYIDQYE